jgi:hypothetical protein
LQRAWAVAIGAMDVSVSAFASMPPPFAVGMDVFRLSSLYPAVALLPFMPTP